MSSKTRKCSFEACHSEHHARGWCAKHYYRWMTHGDPAQVKLTKDRGTPEKRFWSKVDKSYNALDCWLWTGSKDSKGYGSLSPVGGYSQVKAHRQSYEWAYGEIPKGLYLDHKYSSLGCPRHCVNPDHLRPVTNKQNMENQSGGHKGSVSGRRGVSWSVKLRQWISRVYHNNKCYHLGCSPEYELHVAEYKSRNKRLELYTHNEVDREIN